MSKRKPSASVFSFNERASNLSELPFWYHSLDEKIVRLDPNCCHESDNISSLLASGFAGQCSSNIRSKILLLINEFCKQRSEIAYAFAYDDDLCAQKLHDFSSEFLQLKPLPVLAQLMSAANYLRMKSLLELTRKAILDKMDGKSAPELLTKLYKPSYFSPEELCESVAYDAWAYQDIIY